MKRPAYRYAAVPIAVHDGDTYTLNVDLGFYTHAYVRVRLLGWDCPELREPRGVEARDLARKILMSETDLIIETLKDEQTFARWLGRVFVHGVDIGVLLKQAGLAVKHA